MTRFPSRHIVLLAILIAALGLGCAPGCANIHPRYPASQVVWDESILGTWQATDDDGGVITLKIEARPVDVDPADARIYPDLDVPVAARAGEEALEAAPQQIQQYLLHYSTPDGATWTLDGYLLQANAHTFLGFQRQDPFIEENAGWVLPVHLLWKVERAPDRLVFASPNDAVAWIPAIQWADASDDGGDTPIPRRDADRPRPGIRVAESLDRVLDYHARHADDPAFWHSDGSMRFDRIDHSR
jgi:hypothetical protein